MGTPPGPNDEATREKYRRAHRLRAAIVSLVAENGCSNVEVGMVTLELAAACMVYGGGSLAKFLSMASTQYRLTDESKRRYDVSENAVRLD